ncbi:MAG: endonuclease/exonuclease/phosphatase family protein [candidate division WOR-3 bacterium]|nr:MAG: endonuclease/exonuclease/phosphatase family protein [candidate division WOR-3 bacterium]
MAPLPLQLLAIFVTLLLPMTAGAATFRVATYNILNFPDALGYQRIDDLRAAVGFIDPDILVVQEMQSQAGINLFLDSVMHTISPSFSSVPFNDGPDTDNALFFRNDRMDIVGIQYLTTPNRNIAEYRLMLSDTRSELYLFSIHLKASEGSSNEIMRLQEATILRDRLNLLPPGTNFIVAGDFNIYYSDEPAFQKLIDSVQNTSGKLIDPLALLGYWHENVSFADAHTQSTRTNQLPDGGASGGMDDRFDMILCSEGIMSSGGLFLISNSHTILGNDGAHFNLAINDGINNAVPAEIADALYWASDHLPLYVDLSDESGPVIDRPEVRVWPNPMQRIAEITLPWHEGFISARVCMTNILGQRVFEDIIYESEGFTLQRGDLPVGVYFLHVFIKTEYDEHKYRTTVAVVR